jgi:hypothetical protein
MFVTKIIPMCCATMRKSCQMRERKFLFIGYKSVGACTQTHTHMSIFDFVTVLKCVFMRVHKVVKSVWGCLYFTVSWIWMKFGHLGIEVDFDCIDKMGVLCHIASSIYVSVSSFKFSSRLDMRISHLLLQTSILLSTVESHTYICMEFLTGDEP